MPLKIYCENIVCNISHLQIDYLSQKKKKIPNKIIIFYRRRQREPWRAFENVSEHLALDLALWFRMVCKRNGGGLGGPIARIWVLLITHISLFSFFTSFLSAFEWVSLGGVSGYLFMLTSILRVLFKKLVKESFYRKKKN